MQVLKFYRTLHQAGFYETSTISLTVEVNIILIIYKIIFKNAGVIFGTSELSSDALQKRNRMRKTGVSFWCLGVGF